MNKAGRPELPFHAIEAAGEKARLALEDLELLQLLPLTESQRLIFGAKLRWLGRDEEGNWVVRFEPASGVLLTDSKLLASWHPALVDAATVEVVKRQADWTRAAMSR